MNVTNSPVVSQFLQQMIWQSPLLLVYIVGIAICAMRARRAPLAATLAVVGLAILLLATLVVPLVQAITIQNRGGGGAASISQMLMFIGFAGSVLRAAGAALLIAAVFTGRPQEVQRGGFDVPMARAAPGR